jgi:hypothetical protein
VSEAATARRPVAAVSVSLALAVCTSLALAVWTSLALAASAHAASAPRVSVFPIPGSRFNLPATQITFRGVAPGAIGPIAVSGSKTGAHSGTLEEDSDNQGASFIPVRPFAPGETVTVVTGLRVIRETAGRFRFRIAHPAPQPPPAALPRVPAGRNGVQHFRSRPDLLPPSIRVTQNAAPASDGDIFLAPQFGPAQDGPMILDPSGNLVWFQPTALSSRTLTTDFRVQNLYGQSVLTWWQGSTNAGSGRGVGVIFNRNYQVQRVVKAGNGLQMDLHEFLLTPQGLAYVIAVSPVRLPGIARSVMDCVVQEIDLKTGLVLFEWHALDHIGLGDSYVYGPKQPGRILDPYHINSVALDPDGSLIISARNTSTIYDVNHNSGAIVWRLGGKHSSFTMGAGTTTAFQHNAQVQPDGTITSFDDGAGPPLTHKYSRAIRVSLNLKRKTATLVRQYNHSPPISADFEGGVQVLPGGEVFVGWGQQPYFSQFSSAGRQDFDAHFISLTSSYRAYRLPWSAQPPTTPALAAVPHANGSVTVYGSWNGATDVGGWRVLAGPSASALTSLRSSAKRGFESAVTVDSGQPDFALQALGASGQVLATSSVAATPPRIAVYGASAFVSPSALGGVPASCLAAHPCSIVTSVSSGRTLLARSGRQQLGANSGGVLYFRLSPTGRRMLARARHHRLPVQVTAQDSSGIRSTTDLNLIPFRTSGTGPPRRLAPAAELQIVGATDFVSSTGVGGVLASCQSAQTCTVATTVAVGSTVIARTGPERLGAGELGYLIFSLTSQGRSMLAHARGHQLGAHVTLAEGATIASGDIALVPFS